MGLSARTLVSPVVIFVAVRTEVSRFWLSNMYIILLLLSNPMMPVLEASSIPSFKYSDQLPLSRCLKITSPPSGVALVAKRTFKLLSMTNDVKLSFFNIIRRSPVVRLTR